MTDLKGGVHVLSKLGMVNLDVRQLLPDDGFYPLGYHPGIKCHDEEGAQYANAYGCDQDQTLSWIPPDISPCQHPDHQVLIFPISLKRYTCQIG